MKIKKMAVLSAVTAGVLCGVNAQAQFNYSQGDLLVGFSSGAGSDLVVDIGSSSIYTGGVGPSIIYGTGGQQLYTSAQSTAAGLNIDNLNFSIFGDLGASTLFVSRARSVYTTQTTPWNAGSFYAQAPTSSRIEGIGAGAGDSSNGANSSTAAIVSSTYSSGGDISYTVGLGGNGNFGNTFQGIVDGQTSAGFSSGSTPLIEDLYELDTIHNGQPGKLIGEFELDPNGTFSFTPVPEPSTWAMLGVGMTLLAGVRKFPRKAARI
jgi:hypothetical protein